MKKRAAPAGPNAGLAALLVLGTLAGASFFFARGFSGVADADLRLTGELLRIETRDTAPIPFKLKALSGGEVSLSDLGDKVVLLNFWATWCPPCVEEMPSMRRLAARYKDRSDFVLLAVSADDSLDPVRTFFAAGPPEMPVLFDPSGALARQYGTTRFPETYLIDKGRVRAFIEGPRDWDQWFAASYLDEVLKRR